MSIKILHIYTIEVLVIYNIIYRYYKIYMTTNILYIYTIVALNLNKIL